MLVTVTKESTAGESRDLRIGKTLSSHSRKNATQISHRMAAIQCSCRMWVLKSRWHLSTRTAKPCICSNETREAWSRLVRTRKASSIKVNRSSLIWGSSRMRIPLKQLIGLSQSVQSQIHGKGNGMPMYLMASIISASEMSFRTWLQAKLCGNPMKTLAKGHSVRRTWCHLAKSKCHLQVQVTCWVLRTLLRFLEAIKTTSWCWRGSWIRLDSRRTRNLRQSPISMARLYPCDSKQASHSSSDLPWVISRQLKAQKLLQALLPKALSLTQAELNSHLYHKRLQVKQLTWKSNKHCLISTTSNQKHWISHYPTAHKTNF